MTRNEVYELLKKMKQECNGCDYWSGKDCTLVSPENGCIRRDEG